MTEAKNRGNRKVVSGEVISKAGDKTIVVRLSHTIKHPMYGKIVRRYTKVKSHDAENQAKVGDIVSVMETRPISKTKMWRLIEILKTSTQVENIPGN